MNIVKSIPEELVVWSFLAAELNSSRFAEGSKKALKMLNLPKSIVTKPKLGDPIQNQQRAYLLHLTRGWPNQWLFEKFPNNVKWCMVDLTIDELKASYRLKSSAGMSLIERNVGNTSSMISGSQAVENIDSKLVLQIQKKIEAGENILPIILVAKDKASRRVLVEGHSRSIAYALSNQQKIKAILGLSSKISSWEYY